ADAGGECGSLDCTGEIGQLAEQLGGRVNLIVAGNSARPLTTRVAGIPILAAGAGGRTVGVADLVKTPAGGLDFRVGVAPVDTTRVGGNAAFRAALERYGRRNDSLLTRTLAELKRPLVRAGGPYPLGALLAEGRRKVPRTDLGLRRTEARRPAPPGGPL